MNASKALNTQFIVIHSEDNEYLLWEGIALPKRQAETSKTSTLPLNDKLIGSVAT